LGLGLVVTAPGIMPLLFGEHWRPAVPVLQALALAHAFHALFFHGGDVLKALGLGGAVFGLMVWPGLLAVALLLLLVPWLGLPGAALAWILSDAVRLVMTLRVLRREIDVSATELLRPVAVPLIAGVVMASLTWAVGRAVEPGWLGLMAQVLVGAAAYALVALGLDSDLRRRLTELRWALQAGGLARIAGKTAAKS
jgi:O-antigen/teichoic acid export membrane protein